MTYVVTEKCIKCKYTDCVVVCPVDCFYEGKDMLAINPDECIDCGVCEAECPIGAIEPESEDLIEWVEINRSCSSQWPRITAKKDAHPEAEKYKDVAAKRNLTDFSSANS
jgi:ferredoxin